jgi:hypothetical protein
MSTLFVTTTKVSDAGVSPRSLHRDRDRRRIRSRPPENPRPSVILFILSIHVDSFLDALAPPARRMTDMDEQDEQDGDRMERGEALPQRIPSTTPGVDTE